jgi:hypothetical protein
MWDMHKVCKGWNAWESAIPLQWNKNSYGFY